MPALLPRGLPHRSEPAGKAGSEAVPRQPPRVLPPTFAPTASRHGQRRRRLPRCSGAGEDLQRLMHPMRSVDEDDPSVPPKDEETDRDDGKEAARRQFRTVFDFRRWAAHRSTRRYSRHVLGMAQSRIVRGLAAPLLYEAGLAAAVATAHQLADTGLLPWLEPWAGLQLRTTEPFGLTSFALSLLLVFRTNASYARWLDARKTWGGLVNRSRDLCRQGLTWMPDGDGPNAARRDMLCRWVVAFSRSLKCHLREGEDLGAELAGVLPQRELAALLAARHRPNYCLQVLSQVVREAGMTTPVALNMDINLTAFADGVGTCERILREPIPLSYTRHTSRFMIIWLSLLPFSLWGSCRWTLVPVCTLIAFLLLGIEEIGVQIEEPFSILPLEVLCDTIRSNVEELRGTHGDSARGGDGRGGVAAAVLVRSATAGAAVAELEPWQSGNGADANRQ